MSEWHRQEYVNGWLVGREQPTDVGPWWFLQADDARRLENYLNNLEQYKALADRAEPALRAFVPVTASQPDIDAFRKPWLSDYDALKAQEAGQ